MIYNFNYIVTIHNKGHLIKDVLEGITNCAGQKSKIYPVLDGCTDNTEKIIDEFASKNPEIEIIKVFADDVHELRAINSALRQIPHSSVPQLNVILQDDVVLNDVNLENHLTELYNRFNNTLGVISLRHGGNLSPYLLKKITSIFPVKNYVETVFGHGVSGNLKDLEEGCFVFRDIAIKSPICISSKLIARIGIPDEIYQPWDDIAYCYKALQNGFQNGILSANFISEKEWGTMRSKQQQQKHDDIVLKNLNTFRSINGDSFKEFFQNRKADDKVYRMWDAPQVSVPRYMAFAKRKFSKALHKGKMFFKK